MVTPVLGGFVGHDTVITATAIHDGRSWKPSQPYHKLYFDSALCGDTVIVVSFKNVYQIHRVVFSTIRFQSYHNLSDKISDYSESGKLSVQLNFLNLLFTQIKKLNKIVNTVLTHDRAPRFPASLGPSTSLSP